MPDAMLATAANTMAAPTPPNIAAARPETATRTIAAVNISSSRNLLRSGEASPLPTISPAVDAPMTAPIQMLL
jgi:hypothetical protein